jgi:putative ABC transport system substrate-binding protein
MLGLCASGVVDAIAQGPSSRAVGVVYPEIREPFNAVFDDIIAGIERPLGSNLRRLKVEKDDTDNTVNEWVEREGLGAVVVLGRRALDLSDDLEADVPIVAGGLLSAPTQYPPQMSGILLAPAPDALFARLKQLAPRVKRVVVFYNEANTGWLMRFGELAAERHGLVFDARPVESLKVAAREYKELMSEIVSDEDAVWLPQDPGSVDDRVVLPALLRESWDREFVVFSSNPSHVPRGALFSLFPDNVRMGESLGALALNRAVENRIADERFVPLRDLSIAVNVRTAEHLGYTLSRVDIRQFDLVFPAQ